MRAINANTESLRSTLILRSRDSRKEFFTNDRMPEPPRFREPEPQPEPQPKPQPKPDKKDGWVGKDDFK